MIYGCPRGNHKKCDKASLGLTSCEKETFESRKRKNINIKMKIEFLFTGKQQSR